MKHKLAARSNKKNVHLLIKTLKKNDIFSFSEDFVLLCALIMDKEIFSELFKVKNADTDALISHISSDIELKIDEKYGRMLVAKKKFLPSDVLLIEEPLFMSLDKTQTSQIRCANCLKNLTRSTKWEICERCELIKFCSHKCLVKAWENFHKLECKEYSSIGSDESFLLMLNRMLFKCIHICGNLENLINMSIEKSTTAMNSEKERDEKFLLACCLNLECINIFNDFKFVNSYVRSKFVKSLYSNRVQREGLKKIILKILGIVNRNSFYFKFDGSSNVAALFALASLINHSCSPNLVKIKLGKKVAFVCQKTILKGEQLFICYR